MTDQSHADHQHPGMVECTEALLRVFEFLDGEMSQADQLAVRAHLDACAECLRQYDLDQMVKFVVKRSCGQQAAPGHLRASIVQRITVVAVEPTD